MSANYSSATRAHAYQPTVLEHKLLLSRLAMQIAFVMDEFKKDPRGFVKQSARELLHNPRIILAAAVATAVLVVVLKSPTTTRLDRLAIDDEQPPDVIIYEPIDGAGRVGFNEGTGEGSGARRQQAHGGGGGGDHTAQPPQTGELPPPSQVLAAIPTTPPLNPPALPVAGIDIDPALWKDLDGPVYGDPRSNSMLPSKGSGEGEGIGSGRGLGIGSGDGPGVGPGSNGNTGGGYGGNGCCGEGSGDGAGGGYGWGLSAAQVDQRARLLLKPEPQYTEEARRNQVTGTVTLRAIFSSSGEVIQIRALNTLPFGLTERAIAAARQIKFVPALKNGHPVSVRMQLEYNFNLY
jgi:TonB family protein